MILLPKSPIRAHHCIIEKYPLHANYFETFNDSVPSLTGTDYRECLDEILENKKPGEILGKLKSAIYSVGLMLLY